jgi:hypothetical protein
MVVFMFKTCIFHVNNCLLFMFVILKKLRNVICNKLVVKNNLISFIRGYSSITFIDRDCKNKGSGLIKNTKYEIFGLAG